MPASTPTERVRSTPRFGRWPCAQELRPLRKPIEAWEVFIKDLIHEGYVGAAAGVQERDGGVLAGNAYGEAPNAEIVDAGGGRALLTRSHPAAPLAVASSRLPTSALCESKIYGCESPEPAVRAKALLQARWQAPRQGDHH